MWTLILLSIAITGDPISTSITSVPGFRTKNACEVAAVQVEKMDINMVGYSYGYSVRYACVKQ